MCQDDSEMTMRPQEPCGMAEVDYEHVSKVYAGGVQAIADFCRCPRVRWAVLPASRRRPALTELPRSHIMA